MPQCLDALSSSDRHLLTALFDAGGDMIVAAGYVGMEEPELLEWADRPDIRRLVKSERRLRHLKREIKLEAIAMDMLETLQELVHTTDDPVEKRRAASTVLRAIIETNRPKPHRSRHLRAPSASSGRPTGAADGSSASAGGDAITDRANDGSSASASPPSSFLSPQQCFELFRAEQREEESNPLTPASLAKIDANTSAPIPERFYQSPRDLLERVADRIALLPNPTGRRAYLAIYGAIQLEIRKNPRTWDPFKEALEQSPLCTLAGENGVDWTRTIDVSDIDESAEIHTPGATGGLSASAGRRATVGAPSAPQTLHTASATITWMNTNGATKRSHLRLALEPHLGAGEFRWCITHLETDTS